jgi:hypothetical protein
LAKIADKSFLGLWSYPNTFIDKRPAGKGDGKELCDLLVVCGDHILIVSDKSIGWPSGNDTVLAWKRWYKRAILKSVEQIRGAERWLKTFPDRIFLDSKCTQRLPISLPPVDRRKIHGIVVALGAGEARKKYFKAKRGSLFIRPDIKGNFHGVGENVTPFVIGDVDPSGPFVNVLDDETLDIVLGELDTISDLTQYLGKKEREFQTLPVQSRIRISGCRERKATDRRTWVESKATTSACCQGKEKKACVSGHCRREEIARTGVSDSVACIRT